MPIYEYKCNKCHTTFEELVSGATDKTLPCPSCASENTKKTMSTAGISMGTFKDPSCTSSCGSASSGCASGGCPMQHGV